MHLVHLVKSIFDALMHPRTGNSNTGSCLDASVHLGAKIYLFPRCIGVSSNEFPETPGASGVYAIVFENLEALTCIRRKHA